MFVFGCLFVANAEAQAQAHTLQPTEIPMNPAQLRYVADAVLSHDFEAFTEGVAAGLAAGGGWLYESTGLEGMSDIRILDPASGDVVMSYALPTPLFGEGITVLSAVPAVRTRALLQLTYRDQVVFKRDPETLVETARRDGVGATWGMTEMWGLTTDGCGPATISSVPHSLQFPRASLFISNGTNVLAVVDPVSLGVVASLRISVSLPSRGDGRQRVGTVININELEWIPTPGAGSAGVVACNVLGSDAIIGVDVATGWVTWVADASGLLTNEEAEEAGPSGVLNGIAYDEDSSAVFLTGKLWPKLFRGHFAPCSREDEGEEGGRLAAKCLRSVEDLLGASLIDVQL